MTGSLLYNKSKSEIQKCTFYFDFVASKNADIPHYCASWQIEQQFFVESNAAVGYRAVFLFCLLQPLAYRAVMLQ